MVVADHRIAAASDYMILSLYARGILAPYTSPCSHAVHSPNNRTGFQIKFSGAPVQCRGGG
jgi:hypothetical protein